MHLHSIQLLYVAYLNPLEAINMPFILPKPDILHAFIGFYTHSNYETNLDERKCL